MLFLVIEVFSPGFALTDEQERHRCRSAPDAAERRITPGGSLPRGAALEVRDASLQTWPAASTALFNWMRNPGEKTSLVDIRHPGAGTLRCRRIHRGLLQPPTTALD